MRPTRPVTTRAAAATAVDCAVGLTLDDLLPDYRASLNDARSIFGEDGTPEQDGNLARHLRTGARKLSLGKRPRTAQATLQISAGQRSYADVPADLLLPKVPLWALQSTHAPWCLPPGPLPILSLAEDGSDRVLNLAPPPSAEQIRVFGAVYPYYYFAAHTITDDASTSTLQERDRDLVILAAQVEAMRETAMRGAHKPVTLRDGSAGGMPRNGTPAALYQALLAELDAAP